MRFVPDEFLNTLALFWFVTLSFIEVDLEDRRYQSEKSPKDWNKKQVLFQNAPILHKKSLSLVYLIDIY
jgi:hypothetical protein